MPTSLECVCCREINRTVAKIIEENDSTVTCITGHPGLQGVCLNIHVWVLQATYFQYRKEHGSSLSPPSLYEYVQSNNVPFSWWKYRPVAYRQLTRWCWGWLEIGDIVCLRNKPTAPTKWPIVRVVEVHPGQDKRVRVVIVRTARGTYKRPVVKIALLLHPDDWEH